MIMVVVIFLLHNKIACIIGLAALTACLLAAVATLQFLSAKCNERNSGDSLAAMGQRLATEIIDFLDGGHRHFHDTKTAILICLTSHHYAVLCFALCCTDKFPSMLLEGRGYEGRMVFVGHSAGGLVIRKCLEVR